ncbi:ATP-binding cassette domain-containing protein [Actinomadura sp. 6N118]|uniref:ATP-binding cassette domain-containing protein n=1 Tax=Actinomadura sp. 6N118 TaxID=3375151 RepID=UPI0037AC6F98
MTTGGFLWDALRREPRMLARIAFWSVLEASPAFVIGHAIARAIDDGFAASRPWTGMAWLAVLGVAWLVAAFGARQVMLAVAGVVEPFRDRLLKLIVDSTLRRTATPLEQPQSSAVARSTLQVELARDAFAAVISVVRSFAFTVASVTLGMLTLVPEVLWLVLPPFCAGVALFLLSLPALARRQRHFLLTDERNIEVFAEVTGGLRDITACGAEDRVGATADARVAEQATAGRALARVTAMRTLSLSLGGWLPVLALLAGTPWLLRRGADPGVIIGALAYVTQSLTPAFGGLVEGLGVSGVRLLVSLNRILEKSRVPALGARTTPAAGADVTVRGVTFGYGPHADPVIADLDLRVAEGDHLAVLGPSGIGKSTLAALITGIVVPDAGRVLVGGVPADQLEPAARVLIPQEAYVFRSSLWDNLTYLAPGSSERAVGRAVEAVGMAALADRLGGHRAELDPGSLSAGERQLIALARAYLSPARLTILDEATCHLDPAAEALAESAFADRGTTLIVVAHRISSARRAQRVLLMDGTRVWHGTHAELIRDAPGYAELVGHWRAADFDNERESVQ